MNAAAAAALAGFLLCLAALAADRLIRPGAGRHRRRPGDPPWEGRHLICGCHGRDLTAMRDADVLALHPIRFPSAFVTPPPDVGFLKWTDSGPVPLDPDDYRRRVVDAPAGPPA